MAAFKKSTPKTQRIRKEPYTIYSPHTDISERESRWTQQDYRQVVSIDPGLKNLCIRVERRPTDPTNLNIVTLVFAKLDIPSFVDNSDDHVDNTCSYITTLLDGAFEHIIESHYIIIEKQLPINTKMMVIMRHLLTYFEIKLKNSQLLPIIVAVDPKLKTKELGCPTSLNEKAIKKWAVEKAIEILKRRDDKIAIKIINDAPKSKKDDLADTICQVEALFKHWRLPITPLDNSVCQVEVLMNHISAITEENQEEGERPIKKKGRRTMKEEKKDDVSLDSFMINPNQKKINLKISNKKDGKEKNGEIDISGKSITYGIKAPRNDKISVVPMDLLGTQSDLERRVNRHKKDKDITSNSNDLLTNGKLTLKINKSKIMTDNGIVSVSLLPPLPSLSPLSPPDYMLNRKNHYDIYSYDEDIYSSEHDGNESPFSTEDISSINSSISGSN